MFCIYIPIPAVALTFFPTFFFFLKISILSPNHYPISNKHIVSDREPSLWVCYQRAQSSSWPPGGLKPIHPKRQPSPQRRVKWAVSFWGMHPRSLGFKGLSVVPVRTELMVIQKLQCEKGKWQGGLTRKGRKDKGRAGRQGEPGSPQPTRPAPALSTPGGRRGGPAGRLTWSK